MISAPRRNKEIIRRSRKRHNSKCKKINFQTVKARPGDRQVSQICTYRTPHLFKNQFDLVKLMQFLIKIVSQLQKLQVCKTGTQSLVLVIKIHHTILKNFQPISTLLKTKMKLKCFKIKFPKSREFSKTLKRISERNKMKILENI